MALPNQVGCFSRKVIHMYLTDTFPQQQQLLLGNLWQPITTYNNPYQPTPRFFLQHQWPFQDPRLEVPTIYKAYVRPM